MAIEVTKEGYQPLQLIAVAPTGSIVDLGTIRLQPNPGPGLITISGIVTDMDSKQPIIGAEINVEETGQTGISDQSGHFEIKAVDRLNFTLSVRAIGYLSALKMVNFSEPGTGHIDIGLSRFSVGGIQIDSVSANKTDYEAYQPVPITIAVSNTENAARRIQVLVEVENPFGQTIQRLPLEANGIAGLSEPITLLPGENKSFVEEWFTANLSVGWYTIIAKAFDPLTGQILSEQSILVHIVPSQHIDILRVNASPRFTRVGTQERIELTATVVSHSNIETTLNLAYILFDPKLRTVKEGLSTVTVSPEETVKTVTLDQFTYSFDQSGVYSIGIQVLDGPTPEALDISTISVAPSIRVEPTQGITPETVTPGQDRRVKIKIQLHGVQQ